MSSGGMSRRPRVFKGALVGFDPMNPLASVIIFQYNPTQVRRSVKPKTRAADGARADVQRLAGAPDQTIDLQVFLSAADQLEIGDPVAATTGIAPQLAALEMLITPKVASVVTNQALMASGTLEIVPPEAPLTLLVWGAKRIVPVSVESLAITEQAFDPSLSPIQAEVDMSLRVLTIDDFPLDHPGFALYLAHQVTQEALAVVGSAANLAATGASLL